MLAKHKNLIYKTIIAIILIILSIVVYIFFTPIRDVVNLLVISFIIAYTLKPLRNYLSDRLNISAKKSSLLIILLFLLRRFLIIPSPTKLQAISLFEFLPYVISSIIFVRVSSFGQAVCKLCNTCCLNDCFI